MFVGLIVAFGSLLSNMPAATDTRREVFGYLAQHHDRVQLAAALYGVAMAPALVWLSGLYTALRKAEGGRARVAVAALAGGILAAAATVTGALVLGTTANRFADLGPAGSRVFWAMFLLSVGGTLIGEALLIGSTAAVGLRGALFPRWFTIASVILALASVAGGFTIGFATTGIQVVAGVALVLNGAWVVLVSTYLWRWPGLAGR